MLVAVILAVVGGSMHCTLVGKWRTESAAAVRTIAAAAVVHMAGRQGTSESGGDIVRRACMVRKPLKGPQRRIAAAALASAVVIVPANVRKGQSQSSG